MDYEQNIRETSFEFQIGYTVSSKTKSTCYKLNFELQLQITQSIIFLIFIVRRYCFKCGTW